MRSRRKKRGKSWNNHADFNYFFCNSPGVGALTRVRAFSFRETGGGESGRIRIRVSAADWKFLERGDQIFLQPRAARRLCKNFRRGRGRGVRPAEFFSPPFRDEICDYSGRRFFLLSPCFFLAFSRLHAGNTDGA